MEPRRPDVDDVVRRLHAETDRFGEAWSSAVFIPRETAERGGRTHLAPTRMVPWSSVPGAAGYVLVPYGIHQHTLLVGYAPSDQGIHVDVSRFRKRTW